MQLGMSGLGRMGGNIVRRLMRNGHTSVVYDRSADAVSALAKEGATGSTGLADFVGKLTAPKVVWVMLPSGKITHDTIVELSGLLGKGDILIDGGNSKFLDDIAHAELLAPKGITFVASNSACAMSSRNLELPPSIRMTPLPSRPLSSTIVSWVILPDGNMTHTTFGAVSLPTKSASPVLPVAPSLASADTASALRS